MSNLEKTPEPIRVIGVRKDLGIRSIFESVSTNDGGGFDLFAQRRSFRSIATSSFPSFLRFASCCCKRSPHHILGSSRYQSNTVIHFSWEFQRANAAETRVRRESSKLNPTTPQSRRRSSSSSSKTATKKSPQRSTKTKTRINAPMRTTTKSQSKISWNRSQRNSSRFSSRKLLKSTPTSPIGSGSRRTRIRFTARSSSTDSDGTRRPTRSSKLSSSTERSRTANASSIRARDSPKVTALFSSSRVRALAALSSSLRRRLGLVWLRVS